MEEKSRLVKYKCPFCEDEYPTELDTRYHITDSEDSLHDGINGFDMETEPSLVNAGVGQHVDDVIENLASDYETLDENAAEKVAKDSPVSKYRVLRVWEDAGEEIDANSRTSLHWDELTKKQKRVLAYRYKHPEMSRTEVAEKAGYSSSYNVLETMNRYSWMLEEKFQPDNFGYSVGGIVGAETRKQNKKEEPSEEEAEKKTEDETMSDDNTYTYTGEEFESKEVEGSFSSTLEALHKFKESGVELKLVPSTEMSRFEVVKTLIENGEEELAEKVHEGEVNLEFEV